MLNIHEPRYTSTDFPRSTRHLRPPRKRFIYLVLTLLVLYFIYSRFVAKPQQSLSPIPGNGSPSTILKNKTPVELEGKIKEVIGQSWINYSVLVELYNEPFRVSISDAEIYTAASVNKVPILASLYNLAKTGEIDLNQTVTLQAQDIQDYGTGSLRYEEPGTTYSIKTLARLMIKQSDNTAAYILGTHIVGLERIATLLTTWGLTQTDMIQNSTSNQDIAKLFRLMYEEKITDHAYTQEMLSFLKDTDFETRLPAKLPDSVNVYHKIGTEVGTIHDAGLVTDGKITYYIGIFTRDVMESPETDALIGEVSKTVYEYLSK